MRPAGLIDRMVSVKDSIDSVGGSHTGHLLRNVLLPGSQLSQFLVFLLRMAVAICLGMETL